MKFEIVNNLPVPKSRSKYSELLDMKDNECVIFYDQDDFKGAKTFLRRYFKIITQTVIVDDVEQYRIWRKE